MAQTAIGKIDGLPILGSDVTRWQQKAGVAPVVMEFDMLAGDVDKLLAGKLEPVDIQLRHVDGTANILDVYCIQERPASDPHRKRIAVADRRWFWDRGHLLGRYNMLRQVGVKRVPGGGAPTVTQPIVPTLAFAPWSLNNNVDEWRAKAILAEVLERVLEIEREFNGSKARLVLDAELSDLEALPVQSIELDDRSPESLARVLAWFPEIDITVDNDGSVRVFSRVSGKDADVVRGIGDAAVGGGQVAFIDNGRIRPKEVHVLLARRLEVRLEYHESGGATVRRTFDDRFMDNVLAVPDFTLTLATGEVVDQGTWITFDQAFAAWNQLGGVPGIGRISADVVQKAVVPYVDLWTGTLFAGEQDIDADWASRIAAIQNHWRQTFRINRRWIDRFLTWDAYRVHSVDPTSGQRGSTLAFCQFAIINSQRALAQQAAGNNTLEYAKNVDKSVALGASITGNNVPAPVLVSVEDHDQGIVRIRFQTDELKVQTHFLPGNMINIPTADLKSGDDLIAFNSVSRVNTDKLPQMSGTFDLVLILSAVPASPNTDQQLERLVRRPNDARKFLPSALSGDLNDARGPILEVRVGTPIETARVAWDDAFAQEIEKAFGLVPGTPQLDDLIVNKSQAQGGGSIDRIADAIAAGVYASFVNRTEGQITTKLGGEVRLEGFLNDVLYQIGVDGKLQTRLTLSQSPPSPNFASFLPDSTRRFLFQLGPNVHAQ